MSLSIFSYMVPFSVEKVYVYSNVSSTGQWSEPKISVWIFAFFRRGLRLSLTTK